jgi:hypothetical protein
MPSVSISFCWTKQIYISLTTDAAGEIITTKGKPGTDKPLALVTYKDADGFKHEVNCDQIPSIIEK